MHAEMAVIELQRYNAFPASGSKRSVTMVKEVACPELFTPWHRQFRDSRWSWFSSGLTQAVLNYSSSTHRPPSHFMPVKMFPNIVKVPKKDVRSCFRWVPQFEGSAPSIEPHISIKAFPPWQILTLYSRRAFMTKTCPYASHPARYGPSGNVVNDVYKSHKIQSLWSVHYGFSIASNTGKLVILIRASCIISAATIIATGTVGMKCTVPESDLSSAWLVAARRTAGETSSHCTSMLHWSQNATFRGLVCIND